MRSPSPFCLVFLPALILLALACEQSDPSVVLDNSTSIHRTDEVIILSRDRLENIVKGINDDNYPLPVFDSKPLPSQWDDIDGDGSWDELAFLVDMEPGETDKEIFFLLKTATQLPVFETRTNIRLGILENETVTERNELTIRRDELPVPLFTRFQMDGPAWENDKIGFRQYLDGRNARDLFGKTSTEIALDTVGISKDGALEDNYHVMLPWGRDILAVGNSLGIGGVGILSYGVPVKSGVRLDDEQHIIETTSFDILAEGPVRSVFSITYTDWETPKGTYTLTHTTDIRAGMYGYLSEISLQSPFETDTLLTGLVNINFEGDPIQMHEGQFSVLYTHDKQTYDNQWYLGMALVFPRESFNGFFRTNDSGDGITNSFLTESHLRDNKKLSYLTLAGWELSDERFREAGFFEEYARNSGLRFQNPVIVR